MLPKFLENIELLIGKSIQHKVKEEDGDEIFWSKGKVIAIDKVNKNMKRSTFNIVYEDEPDNVWSFPLLLDFEKGDVIII